MVLSTVLAGRSLPSSWQAKCHMDKENNDFLVKFSIVQRADLLLVEHVCGGLQIGELGALISRFDPAPCKDPNAKKGVEP